MRLKRYFLFTFLFMLVFSSISHATVSSETTSSVTYNGNDSTVNFTITFPFISNTDIVAIHTNSGGTQTTWVLNSDYTISGSTLTATTAPATGETLLIYRDIPITQELDLKPRRQYNPELLENAFDKLSLIAKDIEDQDSSLSESYKDSAETAATNAAASADAAALSAAAAGQYYYVADPAESDQGATASGSGDTIYDIVQSVGTSKKATIVLPHTGAATTTTYTFDTSLDLSTYANIFIKPEQGAVITRTTGDETLTMYSYENIIKQPNQNIDGGNSIVRWLYAHQPKGATYTVYKTGSYPSGSWVYKASPSPEFYPNTDYPELSNANFVDLMDDVFDIIGRNGTNFVEGHKVVIQQSTITLSKTWTIPPTQDFELDATSAVFGYAPTTGDAIVIDSCMNSVFKFGLIYSSDASGTSGSLVNINPHTTGPDSLIIAIASRFMFVGMMNTANGGPCLTLDADTSSGSIVSNNIDLTEADGLIALNIPDTHASAEIAWNNIKFSKVGGSPTGVKIGSSTGNNIYHNNFYGAANMSGTDIAIDCYADNNNFWVQTDGAAAGNDVILRSGAANNNFWGQFPDGITDSSGIETNRFNPGMTIDRGDPASVDWAVGSLTTDGSYHDLDCSSVVPAGAKFINFTGKLQHASASQAFNMRKNGNSNAVNLKEQITQVGGVPISFNFKVACDSSRVVEYYATSGSWTTIDIVISGWEF